MDPHRRKAGSAIAVIAAACLFVAACMPAPKLLAVTYPKKPTLYIALIGAMTGESAYPVEDTFQAAKLAFQVANDTGALKYYVEPVLVDSTSTSIDVSSAIQQAIRPPSIVAAVLWTSTGDTPLMTASLVKAGMGFLDVSPTNPGETWPGALRMSAGDDRQVAADVSWILDKYPGTICLVSDGTPRDQALARMASADVSAATGASSPKISTQPEQTDFAATAAGVRRLGCHSVFWAGRSAQAALFRTALSETGPTPGIDIKGISGSSIPMIGTDEILNDRFLSGTEQAGTGTVATCPCYFANYDQGTSLETFIQTYQARYGTAPGPFALEGWDSAQLLLSKMSAGATTRAALRGAISSTTQYRGVAHSYTFMSDGALSTESAYIWFHKDGYAKWLPLGPSSRVLGG
jgi:branched-chain amino acid transport system substrate-binding protein